VAATPSQTRVDFNPMTLSPLVHFEQGQMRGSQRETRAVSSDRSTRSRRRVSSRVKLCVTTPPGALTCRR
jgi:hypothetical protein